MVSSCNASQLPSFPVITSTLCNAFCLLPAENLPSRLVSRVYMFVCATNAVFSVFIFDRDGEKVIEIGQHFTQWQSNIDYHVSMEHSKVLLLYFTNLVMRTLLR